MNSAAQSLPPYDLGVGDFLSRVLGHVNGRVRYVADAPERDVWQSPEETYERGCGDCEDFAIAYWALLREWGESLPDVMERLTVRLGWLLSSDGDVSHMVCLVWVTDAPLPVDPWVLDVLSDEVYVLSESESGLHVAVTLGVDAKGTPTTWVGFGPQRAPYLPEKWAGVLERMGLWARGIPKTQHPLPLSLS